MTRRELAAKVLLVLGAVGIFASLAGAAVGVRVVGLVDALVADDGLLSPETFATLEGSIELAQETLATLESSLERIEDTTRDLSVAFEDGEALLDATADLSEEEIAGSLAAAQQALPALIEAASFIEATLVTLSALPFGPDYDPPEPFEESLRNLERELDGVPEDVREQALLIREVGASLGEVQTGTDDIADDLVALRAQLARAARLLDGHADTATQASAAVAGSQQALGGQLRVARVLIVVLGLALAGSQAVTLAAGWLLLHPEQLRALATRDAAGEPPPAAGE